MNNHDNNYELDADGKPTKVVRDGGRVVTKMTAMDAKTLNDRKTFFDAPGWHRAGYRTSNVRIGAKDEIASAYEEYDREKGEEWRGPNAASARAKATATEAMPMQGRSAPDTAKYKAWRKKQSAAPFVERDLGDTGGVPDPATIKQRSYDAYDNELREAWRKG
jgi:hypothetical protein